MAKRKPSERDDTDGSTSERATKKSARAPSSPPSSSSFSPSLPTSAFPSRPPSPLPALPIPGLAHVAPWNPSCIPAKFPPLPAIADPAVETAVFTHRAMAGPGESNYEQLEFLGDAYVELVSSALVFQTFSASLPSGRCAQIRELIVRNATLAEYARHYRLPERARIPSDIADLEGGGGEKGSRKPKDALTKVSADIFEAYVAGVVVADPRDGVQRVSAWLRDLWAMTIKDQLRELDKRKKTPESNGGEGKAGLHEAKGRLAKIVAVPRAATLRYEDVGTPGKDKYNGQPLYHVGVFLDGWGEQNRQLGTGSALSKKEAGQKAALQALANERLMKTYESKKQVFMAERDSEE